MEHNPNERQKKADERIKRFVTISFALHMAFFLSFGIGSFFAPQSMVLSPSVQIDMVALPNQLKNQEQPDVDLTKPVKEETPPAPPEPAEPPKKEPEPVAKPEPPAQPDPDLMALEHEKELKKKKKAELDAKKRAADALKKIREEEEREQREADEKRKAEIEKRKKDLARLEATRQALRGNSKNDGNSVTGEINQKVSDAYQGHLLDRIRSRWALPAFLQDKGYRASIRMFLDARGNVIKMEFVRVSGNTLFDDNVEAAIRKAGPFMPPPAELLPALKPGVMVQFPL